MNIQTLERMSLAELEVLYRDTPLGQIPTGVFHGTVLHWLDNPGARDPFFHTVEWFGFDVLRWGIRFDRWQWWFLCQCLSLGRFDATVGPSRWRDTETHRLRYERACLPRFVRDTLYDEVKPLGADLCLGIGGINRGRGEGDHFFYALYR